MVFLGNSLGATVAKIESLSSPKKMVWLIPIKAKKPQPLNVPPAEDASPLARQIKYQCSKTTPFEFMSIFRKTSLIAPVIWQAIACFINKFWEFTELEKSQLLLNPLKRMMLWKFQITSRGSVYDRNHYRAIDSYIYSQTAQPAVCGNCSRPGSNNVYQRIS